MPLFLIPLAEILFALLKSLVFWKSAAFLAVLLGAGTDVGRSVFMWIMTTIMGLVLGFLNGAMPSLPQSVPSLLSSLPIQMQQVLSSCQAPFVAQTISTAIMLRLVISFIPFRK